MRRLFLALQPTPAQAEVLVATAAPLVQELAGRPLVAPQLHATLCFIGSVDDGTLAALRDTLARVHGRHVQLELDAIEYWETPEILCATAVESPSARDLSAALVDAVSAAGCAPDRKPFRAHVTLARKVRRRVARNFEWPRALASMSVHRDEFVLMESHRGEAGSTYSVVDSWPLYEK